jgi:hypothetical protein
MQQKQLYQHLACLRGSWKYMGETLDGLPHGHGQCVWFVHGRGHDIYDGEFERDLMNGRGCIKWASGDSFDGSWHKGKQSGTGILTWANNDTFVGEWHDGKRCGFGTLIRANGDTTQGVWSDAVCIATQDQGAAQAPGGPTVMVAIR